MRTRPTPSPARARFLLVLALAVLPRPAAAVDLCAGVAVTDKLQRPMTALARPALGATAVDPEFGTTIRRITDVATSPSGGYGIVPTYSTTSAWNADESLLLLYHVGRGHELYDGRTYAFIRSLDINPFDLEQVWWDSGDPEVFYYPSGNQLIRYHARSGVKDIEHTFTSCSGAVHADSHSFTSWDSRLVGLACTNPSQAFFYHIGEGRVSGTRSPAPSVPFAGAGGQLGLLGADVVDNDMVVRRTLIANTWEHSSMGRFADGRETWNIASYDNAPGAGKDQVGSIVTFDLTTGDWRVVIGPDAGWPYPPSSTHPSALAYQAPGWVLASIVGCVANGSCSPSNSGRNVLDNEILLANTNPGETRVCRVAHHRSWGKGNTKVAQPYWAEPHAVPSPSGTRILFASDWGNGATIDCYVIELPSYGAPASLPRPVPDGAYDRGTPMRAVKAAGGAITVAWDASCAGGNADYNLFFGDLADQPTYTYSGAACALGTAGRATFAAPAGSVFWLMAGEDAAGVESGHRRGPGGAGWVPATGLGWCPSITAADTSESCP